MLTDAQDAPKRVAKKDVPKTTYSAREVARLLDISPRTALHYLTAGRIEGTQNPFTGTWTVRREALTAFLEKSRVAPATIGFPIHVLVIDDEPAIARSVEQILGQSGMEFRVDSCPDGYVGLIQLGSQTPDVILLDSRMPYMNGKQVIQAIRSQTRYAALKILIITSYTEDIEELVNLGANDALIKPFDRAVLLEKVLSLLPSSKLANAARPSGDEDQRK